MPDNNVMNIVNKVISIDAIKPHQRNYRSHPDAQIKQLGSSYQRFGQFRSVVVHQQTDGSYVQVAGHGIVEAMKRNGATSVRVDVLPVETSASTIEAILVADNNLSNGASDDEELLAQLLTEQRDAGYDLASLGSDEESLRQMLEGLGNEVLEGEEEESERDIPGLDAPDLPYKNQFAVAVMCPSESEQQTVFETLTKQGYTCKVLVV
jgi:ParB-like chromosome segregation protein Spo0J